MKRMLVRYGYPPDLQDEAVQTVLKQAELLSQDWSAACGDGDRDECILP